MSRTVQRLVGLALLTVLSGTPAVAAMCAALCLPVHHAPKTDENQGCHGRSSTGPVATSREDADCADHGLAALPTKASLVASRALDLAAMPALERPDHLHALTSASSAHWRPVPVAVAPTLRPVSSSLVLRI